MARRMDSGRLYVRASPSLPTAYSLRSRSVLNSPRFSRFNLCWSSIALITSGSPAPAGVISSWGLFRLGSAGPSRILWKPGGSGLGAGVAPCLGAIPKDSRGAGGKRSCSRRGPGRADAGPWEGAQGQSCKGTGGHSFAVLAGHSIVAWLAITRWPRALPSRNVPTPGVSPRDATVGP